jgi:RNA polymerase sigma-B factor
VSRTSSSYDRRKEQELLLRYHRTGEPELREELVRRLLPFARELGMRYAYTEEPIEDLVQVASLGLLKAIDRYDPARGANFVSYATPTIVGELKRHFRDKGWAMHVPRDLQERALAVTRCRERLSTQLGRSPTVREAAAELGWDSETVLEATATAADYSAASLDAPLLQEEPDAATLIDTVGADDHHFGLVEDRVTIADSWGDLSDLERRVLRLRVVDELTQREIGDRVGYSQMHVSRVLRRALTRLHAIEAA